MYPHQSGSATSIPPAHSEGDKARGKRKRPTDDDDEDSSSSTMSKPKLVKPISSAAPSSSYAPLNLFYLTDALSL